MAAVVGTPTQPSLYCPTDGEYVVQKRTLLNGQTFEPGDRLPLDNPVRHVPRRLLVLCRQRVLALQSTPFSVPEAVKPPPLEPIRITEPEPVLEPVAEVVDRQELLTLGLRELQAMCKERGLSHRGNKSQLRKRLTPLVEG
jgi:hypothetical protein